MGYLVGNLYFQQDFCVYMLSHIQLFCDPMDCSPPGSSVHGIFQARKLEWVAISYSRGSSSPRNQTHVSCVSCIGRWILYHQHDLRCPIFVQSLITMFATLWITACQDFLSFTVSQSLLRLASLVAQTAKNLPATQETQVGKIPWRREWLPTPVFLPGEIHGQGSLAGYSPWVCKESDLTEQLTLSLSRYLGGVKCDHCVRRLGKHKSETEVINSEFQQYLVWFLHPVLEPVCRARYGHLRHS